MARNRKASSRFRRFEVTYILICLCLDSFTGASTGMANAQLKDRQSSLHFDNIKNNNANKVESPNESLIRKSRQSPQLIPIPRMGRSESFDANSIMPYPDSWIIPYLPKSQEQLETTLEYNFEDSPISSEYTHITDISEENEDDFESDVTNNISEEYLNEIAEKKLEFGSHVKERQTDDNGTVIPYPRFGKRDLSRHSNDESGRIKRSSESLIPQIRYGRSVPEEKSAKVQKMPLYILPNYRPGRSVDEKSSKLDKFPKQGMLPYPRPGRSGNEYERRHDSMVPLPRYGRFVEDDVNLDKTTMEILMQFNPVLKSGMKSELSQELKKPEESQVFVIPYPRPGKRFFGTKPLPPNVKLEVKGKDMTLPEMKEREPLPTVFVVPYPRPGRSTIEQRSNNYLLPTVRFGRSVSSSLVPYPRFGRSKSSEHYMLPYPRLGRSGGIVPYPRLGRSTSSILPYPRLGRSTDSILPYPRFGRSNNQNISEYILPYPRFGRSIIPQIRVGKSLYGSTFPIISDLKELEKIKDASSIQNEQESDNASNEIEENKKDKPTLLIPAKKLHEHSITNYMLPYPRPGRFV